MSYTRVYENRINWQNYPDVTTPIDEINLNKMDYALNKHDETLSNWDLSKANQTDMLQAVKTIEFDDTLGRITITFFNGTTTVIDTLLEKLAVNFDFDDDPTSIHYQNLIITLDDGTMKYVDMSALITQYEFIDSSTMHFTINQNGQITVDIIDGSITGAKLQPNFLADCQEAKNTAIAKASQAGVSESNAEAWARGTRNGIPVGPDDPTYHNNSAWWSMQSNVTILAGLTDVVVDNPTDSELLMYDSTAQKWKNSGETLKLPYSVVEGTGHSIGTQSTGYPIHVEGVGSTIANNALCAHAEGVKNYAGPYAHAEGISTSAKGSNSHTEGNKTFASGSASHSEGAQTTASGTNAHSEGYLTQAKGQDSHAEGTQSTAQQNYSHAEGDRTYAGGFASHAQGRLTNANGDCSFAAGNQSTANTAYSMAVGLNGKTRYWINNKFQKDRIFAVGSGRTYSTDLSKRDFAIQNSEDANNDLQDTSNIVSLDKQGNMFIKGFPYLVKGVCNNRLIADGDFYILEDGASYLLFTHTRMKNNGAWRGMQAYYICQPFMPNLSDPGITTSANALPVAHQFSTSGTAGLTLQKTAVAYDDGTGTTKWRGCIGIGSCVANCVVRYSLLKVIGSEVDFATNYDV